MKCHGDLKSVLLVQFQKYEDADRREAVLFSFVTSMGGGAGKFRDIYFYFGVLEWVSVIFTTYADAEELVSYPRMPVTSQYLQTSPLGFWGFGKTFKSPSPPGKAHVRASRKEITNSFCLNSLK